MSCLSLFRRTTTIPRRPYSHKPSLLWTPRRHTLYRTYATSSKDKSAQSASPFHKEKDPFNLQSYGLDRIRNFCITAHIDHGKTTLSNRLLEFTGTITESKVNELYLDKLRVEKERGITVKAQTATMFFKYLDGETYILNLIDTPGHVDFTYEVSRSMAACEGAVLLVDASKGVQAQTVANYYLAVNSNLELIPALNKIDLPTARPSDVKKQLQENFQFEPDNVLSLSAASGIGIEDLLLSVIERIPPPKGNPDGPLKMLLFDSWYGDVFSGVICLVKLIDGSVKVGDRIQSASTGKVYEVVDVGIMNPEEKSTTHLFTGQVGYLKLGMKSTSEARVGDTFFLEGKPVQPLPGFKPAKPMVYAGLYPDDAGDFNSMREAIDKLCLTDAAVTVHRENNDILGMGFKCGFLGLLHMDVFMQRLRQEYAANVIATAPNVPLKVYLRDGTVLEVTSPGQWPPRENILEVHEPMVKATILAPKEYMGPVLNLCTERRGEQIDLKWLDEKRMQLIYRMPLSEVIFDFFDKLKQISSGYATLDYEDDGFEKSPLEKLTVLLNGKPVDPLSVIVHRDKAQAVGRNLVSKLKETIHRQMFEIRVQAALGTKIVARETIKPFRKDVTAKCYGGDFTRKRKLLEKQKEGKKRMRQVGEVSLNQDAFLAVTKIHT